jgi:16S rRNA (guanine527-N7)-methyltransferase
MQPLSHETIRIELSRYGITANAHLCAGISAYIELLLRWNSKISLTAVTDPLEVVRFHFGESLFALSTTPISFGRLADVGSGAGFPGLPLRMTIPDLELYLIEPNLKKAAFLSEIVRTLGLENVEVLRFRMEDLPVEYGDFDFISARALGQHEAFLHWSRNRLKQVGKIILWIGESDASSIQESRDWLWKPPIRIPGSQERVILTGSPKPL